MAESVPKSKSASKSKPVEQYLKVPYRILGLAEGANLNYGPLLLLAHVYSFGGKGCWQSNKQLSLFFQRTTRTVTGWIAELSSKGLIYIKNPKGYYRTIWAKDHPDVSKATKAWADSQNSGSGTKKLSNVLEETFQRVRRKAASDLEVSCAGLRRNLPTINRDKKDKKETTPPAPMPAGGQASAAQDNDKPYIESTDEQRQEIAQRAGLCKHRDKHPRMSMAEKESRRQKIMSQLEAMKVV